MKNATVEISLHAFRTSRDIPRAWITQTCTENQSIFLYSGTSKAYLERLRRQLSHTRNYGGGATNIDVRCNIRCKYKFPNQIKQYWGRASLMLPNHF